MRIINEIALKDFKFWSGAKETAEELSEQHFNSVETLLEELYPFGMTETEVNDFFWHERDKIAQWLWFKNWEDHEQEKK